MVMAVGVMMMTVGMCQHRAALNALCHPAGCDNWPSGAHIIIPCVALLDGSVPCAGKGFPDLFMAPALGPMHSSRATA